MAISSGLSINYNVSGVTYRLLDPDDDFNLVVYMVLPGSATDISYWDDAIYALADQIVTTSGYSFSSIQRLLAPNEPDNQFTLDPLPYPKP